MNTTHPADPATNSPETGTRTRAALWAAYAAALVALYAGAAALVRSGIGADPYGAFLASATRWGITPGTASFAFTAATVAVCWAAGTRPRTGTLILIVTSPILFDAFWVALEHHTGPAVWAAGFTLITAGAAGVAATGLGAGAPETITVTAARHGISMRTATWARDATFGAAAVALGGPVGLGTIALVALFSPTFTAAYRIWQRALRIT